MDKNKVKIELYKSKVMANISHYRNGNLFYTVEMESGKYQFPINTVEDTYGLYASKYLKLSEDLGTTSFYNEMKGSELNRWIGKAIDNEEFLKIG